MSSLESRLLAVIQAARKRLSMPVTHKVGANAQTVAEVDRLLKAGEEELRLHVSGGEPTPSAEQVVNARFLTESSG
jgi:hypothetical protein